MAGVRDHTELDVWRLGDELRDLAERLADRPSFRSESELRDQLLKAVNGVCPHVAEGFSRYYPREFAPFVRIACGSLSEAIDHLRQARSKGLISEDEARAAQSLARRARAAAARLVQYLESDAASRFRSPGSRR
jgi:four helix bundle protein